MGIEYTSHKPVDHIEIPDWMLLEDIDTPHWPVFEDFLCEALGLKKRVAKNKGGSK